MKSIKKHNSKNTKVCPQCNQLFEVRSPSEMSTRVYCSKQCQSNSNKKEKKLIRCQECNKEFQVPPCLSSSKYCSRKCKDIGHRKIKDGLNRQCNVCKKIQLLNSFSGQKEYICKTCRAKMGQARCRTPSGRFVVAAHIAKKRSLIWDISKNEYFELIQQKCYYCYGPLNETGTGLDRKDNNQGYVLNNVVPCCCDCNRTRGDHFTYEEMLRLAVLIREIKQERILMSEGHEVIVKQEVDF